MTLTIELSPERESLLAQAAARQGVTVPELAGKFLEEALQDLEQDKEDLEEARHVLATSDPSERRTLDDLRKAWNL